MEISRRRSVPLDFDEPASPATSSYPPTYVNCRTTMYTMQTMKLTPEPKASKPYQMKTSLSIDSATSAFLTPKKDNIFSSMVGAFTSIVVNRFAKVPGSFMTNINNSLSVTVVPNEGIISQEFFKNLTRSCEQLASENHNESKGSTTTPERLSNKSFYDTKSHMFTENVIMDALSGKVSLNLKDNIDRKESNEKSCVYNNKNDITSTPRNCVDEKSDIIYENNTPSMNVSHTEVFAVDVCDRSKINSTETEKETELLSSRSTGSESCSSRSTVSKVAESPIEEAPSEETGTTKWYTMWQKVVNGMTERFNPRVVSPDSEVPTKKAKPRRKICPVACGRGKGRGKSQLRRSGVSQSRHRKERTKQNISSNIQDDLEAWEEWERYEESGDEESSKDPQRNDEQRSPCEDPGCGKHCSAIFENFNFEESFVSRKRKQRTRDGSVKCPVRVRYVPESSSMNVEPYDNVFIDEVDCSPRICDFRPRLFSESSVDSEDSYCIVFESGSDSEYTDYDYDAVTDEDLDEEDMRKPKVRFNLDPQIHTMFQWDYAYRAARRGPWEEMARDRERFRGRIHCIERILDPILSSQHRKCVWKERFDIDD